jgi:hypothetical protein
VQLNNYMKSFKEFLLEERSQAPHGVLLYKDKIIVGAKHRQPVKISDKSLLQKIQKHGEEHGYFYEGDGGDAKQPLFNLSNIKDYTSGYDRDFNKSLKEFPYQQVSMIAGNTKVNKQYDQIVKYAQNGKKSIFDGILEFINKGLPDDNFPELTPKILEKFLKRVNFLDRAKNTKATRENAKKFITDMENEGYEHKDSKGKYDWKEANTEMQKVSQEGEDLRNYYILDKAKPGVYIIGSGHLESMKRILDERDEEYDMIGGEDIE